MGATGALLALAAVQAGTSMAGAYSQSKAMKAQGAYESQAYEANARIADLQAEDAIRRGNEAAAKQKKATKKLVGSQRAAMAAQGLDLDADDALLIQQESAELGALDAMEIKNNAWREAWGYRSQALDYRNKGSWAASSAKNRAKNTLLTGGLQAANALASGAAYASFYGGGGGTTKQPDITGDGWSGYRNYDKIPVNRR